MKVEQTRMKTKMIDTTSEGVARAPDGPRTPSKAQNRWDRGCRNSLQKMSKPYWTVKYLRVLITRFLY